MPGSKNLSKYLGLVGKNGLKVGFWVKPSLPGFAVCTWCDNNTINFKGGVVKLNNHSEAEKHKKQAPSQNEHLQLTLEESLPDAAANQNKEIVARQN